MVKAPPKPPKKGGATNAARDRQSRFRLTKPQKAYVGELLKLENRVALCREFINLWMQFFRFFAADLSEKEITQAEEKAFFQAMSALARKHFLFVEMMGDTFDRGGDVIDVLGVAVSLANIQVMPENTRSKLELDWHNLFLDMNRALGRLIRRLPGNMSLSEALASLSKTAPAKPAPKPAQSKGK